MNDVVAVLEERNAGGPLHIEFVAYGVTDAGLDTTTDIGLKAIAKALANCPRVSAKWAGSVGIELGSEAGSLFLAVKIRSVTVNIVIKGEAEMIEDNATITVNECHP